MVTKTLMVHDMCVLVKRGLVVMKHKHTRMLEIYLLRDGSFVRSVGHHHVGFGGLCAIPDGDGVLVADPDNDCVQEVTVVDPRKCPWTRFIGHGVLRGPHAVHCNAHAIAVSEYWQNRVTVLSWHSGCLVSRITHHSSPAQLRNPTGVHILDDSSRVIVSDSHNDRLCMFTLGGELVASVNGVHIPDDVSEQRGGFLIRNMVGQLTMIWRDGRKIANYSTSGRVRGLATLPDGGVATQCYNELVVFYGLDLRMAWLAWLCVSGLMNCTH